MALQRFSFKTEHIEEAMKKTLLYGGDLHSALDWLCLNLPDGTYSDRELTTVYNWRAVGPTLVWEYVKVAVKYIVSLRPIVITVFLAVLLTVLVTIFDSLTIFFFLFLEFYQSQRASADLLKCYSLIFISGILLLFYVPPVGSQNT